jgi:hypothetical protein
VQPIEDIVDKLPKKAAWETLKRKWIVAGVWDGKTYLEGFRKPEDITCITIHHSGSPEGTLTSHANAHARRWGAGIAYHVAIDKGRIYQTNDLLTMSYHAGNNNTYSVGIVCNRDLTKSDLTDEERKLLYAAILSVKAVIPTITDIKGHNEMPTCKTACPATDMNRIRADVYALEQDMARSQSPQKREEIAFRIANEILFLYRMAKDGIDAFGKPVNDQQKAWAQARLLQLEPEMRRLGFLK